LRRNHGRLSAAGISVPNCLNVSLITIGLRSCVMKTMRER